jgi:hypothetical protein
MGSLSGRSGHLRNVRGRICRPMAPTNCPAGAMIRPQRSAKATSDTGRWASVLPDRVADEHQRKGKDIGRQPQKFLHSAEPARIAQSQPKENLP